MKDSKTTVSPTSLSDLLLTLNGYRSTSPAVRGKSHRLLNILDIEKELALMEFGEVD